jgi:hypothetical protein
VLFGLCFVQPFREALFFVKIYFLEYREKVAFGLRILPKFWHAVLKVTLSMFLKASSSLGLERSDLVTWLIYNIQTQGFYKTKSIFSQFFCNT